MADSVHFPQSFPQNQGADDRSPQATVVNCSNGNGSGSMGIGKAFATYANTSAMAVIAGLFVWILHTMVDQNRTDRVVERQERALEREQDRADRERERNLFTASLEKIHSQADRHTGEMKGAIDANSKRLDVNTKSMEDLSSELRRAREAKVVGPQKPSD